MSEPPPEAYEAADRAISDLWATPRYDLRQRTAQAAVDAVWPLALALGRMRAAEEIRAQITAGAVPPVALRSGAVLRANSVADWAASIAEGTGA